MTSPAPFSQYQCLGLGRRALHQLRASLDRDRGVQTAALLQEAGVAAVFGPGTSIGEVAGFMRDHARPRAG